MEEQTFRSRLVDLLGKSRKATRLYSGVTRSKKGSVLAEIQATEWLNVNNELVSQLSLILDEPTGKKLTFDITTLIDQLTDRSRNTIQEMQEKRRKLIAHAEIGDYVQAHVLSKELVSIKARVQALQAVFSELNSVIKRERSQVETQSFPQQELANLSKPPAPQLAKVIQLRQKQNIA
ncbi:MAG: hypothetical protein SGJ02_07260 [bacterium]|nr:hypothetical protein [bacterium]